MNRVIDRDEYGREVSERYRRLGAGSESAADTGLFVRFEPGFGLNVHIGRRVHLRDRYGLTGELKDTDLAVLSIGGWQRLCELVDEYRARPSPPSPENPE